MITTAVLIIVVAAALLLLAWAARGQSTAVVTGLLDLPGRTTAIDVAAFRNLISPEEENYLRQKLPAAEFKRIHRQRMRAAIAYIQSALQNASVLLRLGQVALRSADPQLAAAGRKLVDTAIRLRIYAFFALLKLYCSIAFPNMPLSSPAVADRYERLTEAMARLIRLQQPGLATRISLTL